MSRPLVTLVLVWAALAALLAATVALTFAPIGPWRLPLSLLIAAAKAGLIAWIFMELRREAPLVRIAALVGLMFLLFLIGMAGIDTAIRG